MRRRHCTHTHTFAEIHVCVCVCSTAWRPLGAPMPLAWRACAFFILSRICCAACQRSPPSHHHVRLLDRLLPWLESEPLPLPASLLLPLTWANITGAAAAAVELATETALRYAAKLCALPANPFCRINWQLFAARGETRQTLFTSRQKKAATLHAAKNLALALSLYLSFSYKGCR